MELRDIVLVTAVVATLGHTQQSAAVDSGKINAHLLAEIESSNSDDPIGALLVLDENVEISAEIGILARQRPNPRDRYYSTYHGLRRKTQASQSGLINDLREKISRGLIAEFRPFWITDAVYILAPGEELLELASRSDVARVIPDMRVDLIEPVAELNAAGRQAGPTDNLIAVGARALWDRGLTGTGQLICSFDTGVEGSHPALAPKWRGNHVADSSACWFDPFGSSFPIDPSSSGHGTHVMGIMVGHEGADTIGLAPDAQWICAAVVDRGEVLQKTIADILEAFEWAANPDGNLETMDDVPGVVCNAWGIPKGFIDQCGETFWNAIDNLESMGIVCIFAAGNEGPGSVTIRNPADRATSPTNNFAVGAVDEANPAYPVASFSSRGPSSCDLTSKKPEVVAPGVAVRSAQKGGGYKLMTGTSMAAPHIAAAVALFKQYNPGLTPEQIKSAILLSAIDIEGPGEDNESGMGFVDLAAALEMLPEPIIPAPQIEDVAFEDGENNLLDPADAGSLIITLRGEITSAFDVVGYLFTTTPGIHIAKDTTYFGTVSLDGFGDNADDPFTISTAATFEIGDTISFTLTLVGDSIPGYISREFEYVFGVPYHGDWVTLNNGTVAMTITNFGLFGLHDESYVPLGGRGYEGFEGNNNFLYEAGLVLKSGTGHVSDGVRTDGLGEYCGDFRPADSSAVEVVTPGSIGDFESITRFDDSGADVPLDVAIRQRAAAFSGAPGSNCIFIEWTITNTGGSALNELCVGLFTDWDIPGDYHADQVVVDPDEDLFYQHHGTSAPVVGVAILNVRMSAARFYDNGAGKRAFSKPEKYGALNGPVVTPGGSAADWCGFVAAGPYDLTAGDSVTIAFAFCSGQTVADFYAAVTKVRNEYMLATGIVEDERGLPREHELVLYQNYPNPFNPETRIDYVMPADGWVEVGMFDILGRKVATLYSGSRPAGMHTIVWRGTDNAGQQVASGIYLCRVSTRTETKTRKMVLVR